MATRVSTHWDYNPNLDITEFDKDKITKNNLVNMMLLLKQSDVSSSLVMNLFGSFNGKSLCHHYDTFTVPVGGFSFINKKGKLVSNSTPFDTTFGIWVFNIFMIQGFQFSFIFDGYVNSEINKKTFNKLHQQILYALIEDKISVENYKKFII